METQVTGLESMKDDEIATLIIKAKALLDKRFADRQKEEERLRQMMIAAVGHPTKKRGRRSANVGGN
jgi:hypothetical protein